MSLVLKSEVLYHREHLTKPIGDLYHGRYLLVEVAAINCYDRDIRVRPTDTHPHLNLLVPEPDLGTVEPKVPCCFHKLHEKWKGKRGLLEEYNIQVFEARGRDPTNNRFQVSADASEPEEAKVRECNVCRDWRMCELRLRIMVWNREAEVDLEIL